MNMLTVGVAVLLISVVYTVTAEISEAETLMKNFGVIPDVIDEGPKNLLKITYDGGLMADKGVELTPAKVKKPPQIEWIADNVYYTLLMTDPDAPSRADPEMREWHHWLVVNILGSDLSSGEVLSEYIGSGPPKDTGLHRYVLLVYKQPGKLVFDEKHLGTRSAEGRSHFSTRQFVEKYNLSVPVAGNLYQAQWDDYVPSLHKQIGF